MGPKMRTRRGTVLKLALNTIIFIDLIDYVSQKVEKIEKIEPQGEPYVVIKPCKKTSFTHFIKKLIYHLSSIISKKVYGGDIIHVTRSIYPKYAVI